MDDQGSFSHLLKAWRYPIFVSRINLYDQWVLSDPEEKAAPMFGGFYAIQKLPPQRIITARVFSSCL